MAQVDVVEVFSSKVRIGREEASARGEKSRMNKIEIPKWRWPTNHKLFEVMDDIIGGKLSVASAHLRAQRRLNLMRRALKEQQ
jgi:hypothetical protein